MCEANSESESAPAAHIRYGAGRAATRCGSGLTLCISPTIRNLQFFSLGQGGYFSPQSYFATLLPVHYTSKSDSLDWSIGGSVGYQVYNESASPVFPDNPGLQSQLFSTAATTPGLLTSYPSHSASGVVGGVDGSVDYRVSDNFRIGGRANYQHAGNWSETMRHCFSDTSSTEVAP